MEHPATQEPTVLLVAHPYLVVVAVVVVPTVVGRWVALVEHLDHLPLLAVARLVQLRTLRVLQVALAQRVLTAQAATVVVEEAARRVLVEQVELVASVAVAAVGVDVARARQVEQVDVAATLAPTSLHTFKLCLS